MKKPNRSKANAVNHTARKIKDLELKLQECEAKIARYVNTSHLLHLEIDDLERRNGELEMALRHIKHMSEWSRWSVGSAAARALGESELSGSPKNGIVDQ